MKPHTTFVKIGQAESLSRDLWKRCEEGAAIGRMPVSPPALPAHPLSADDSPHDNSNTGRHSSDNLSGFVENR